jgi:hypothetical protein
MVITNKDKAIKYLSYSYTGKWHDYKILKDILEPGLDWFKNVTLKVDLGYLGIKKDYTAAHIEIPHKKTKLKPLTETQKDENKKRAAERVKVAPKGHKNTVSAA